MNSHTRKGGREREGREGGRGVMSPCGRWAEVVTSVANLLCRFDLAWLSVGSASECMCELCVCVCVCVCE